MKFWWVNHKQTFKEEIGGGFIWSPQLKANGSRNHFYENMTKVRTGDIIFSYADGRLRAVGVATAVASASPKPFSSKGDYWNDLGWFIPVDWGMLATPFSAKQHISDLEPVLPEKYSPINKKGDGNQGAYLAELNDTFVQRLLILMGADFHNSLALAGGNTDALDESANDAQKLLEQRTDIGATEIHQLVKARRGQGIYKSNVRLVENHCRVTKLELPQHLIASHIKPWKVSTDFEKLDCSNGLLLSPHVDHLFDRGYISFEPNGRLLLSKQLQYRVLAAWHIDPDTNVGGFTSEQQKYLEYHRDLVLKSPA